jgi:hypothetical protein
MASEYTVMSTVHSYRLPRDGEEEKKGDLDWENVSNSAYSGHALTP